MPDLLEQGLILFNSAQYYAAHEVWENLWRETRGPLRVCYQGLVQAAVGLHHYRRGNFHGAAGVLGRAIENLSAPGQTPVSLDCPDLVRQLQGVCHFMLSSQHNAEEQIITPRIVRLK